LAALGLAWDARTQWPRAAAASGSERATPALVRGTDHHAPALTGRA
jgi:hypothetical protein